MLEGYRTILVALLGTIAQGLGITFDVDATAQAIILLVTLIGTIYFKLKANQREKALTKEDTSYDSY